MTTALLAASTALVEASAHICFGSKAEELTASTTSLLHPLGADVQQMLRLGGSGPISGIMLCNKSRVDDAGTAHSIALVGRG